MTPEASRRPLLYGYWRSSSAYRVRIALNLKGIEYEQKAVHLVRNSGEQKSPEYREVNPLGLVPALIHRNHTLVQSVAICEYLEEAFPAPPLLPVDCWGRARVRAMVQTITSEMQPMNNLGVMQYLEQEMQQDADAIKGWYCHWVARGFGAIETWLRATATGAFCHGHDPTLADCFLVPQVYNAERFECDLEPYPLIRRISAHCRAQEAFRQAAPENQPDAPRPK
ncbi:MAG: maleylacetoacetate isomerase [Xanthomonadales bacterium]|nr:maleylacetoacetate isomerase [Xanthomonadales bacterium]